DAAGNAYLTGVTSSASFPTTPAAFDTSFNGVRDAFVTKLNPTGSALVYSTFLGGADHDIGRGIALDAAGSAYVTGETFSADFPSHNGAFDVSFTTLDPPPSAPLLYSTFLGGANSVPGGGTALDAAGSTYLTGDTVSTDFPTTPGAFDTSHNGNGDAFVTKL